MNHNENEIFIFFFYVVVRAISAELVAESSLQTGNAKLSTVLQAIINRESLLRFTTVLCLMVDVAYSKKKDALFLEKIQSVTTEIHSLTFILNLSISYCDARAVSP